MRITDFKALTFDCYGTLIDWETGILNRLRPWADAGGIDADDGALLAAYSQAESRCQQATPTAPYPDILRDVHRAIARRFGLPPDAHEADALARSVGDWPAFADTAAALQRFQRVFRLVIVSNVDQASFDRTRRKLGVAFDAVVTADQVGAYKPDPRMFLRAIEAVRALGIDRSGILHVAQSLYHDHVPAARLGLATVWVDRRRGKAGSGATPPPQTAVDPDFVVTSLRELADRLDTA